MNVRAYVRSVLALISAPNWFISRYLKACCQAINFPRNARRNGLNPALDDIVASPSHSRRRRARSAQSKQNIAYEWATGEEWNALIVCTRVYPSFTDIFFPVLLFFCDTRSHPPASVQWSSHMTTRAEEFSARFIRIFPCKKKETFDTQLMFFFASNLSARVVTSTSIRANGTVWPSHAACQNLIHLPNNACLYRTSASFFFCETIRLRTVLCFILRHRGISVISKLCQSGLSQEIRTRD